MTKHMALSLLLVLGLARLSSANRKLLVFLIDGFRFDYIDDNELKSLLGFKEIVDKGVKVDYLTPDFPSLSYPNYYTLMTGEYFTSICCDAFKICQIVMLKISLGHWFLPCRGMKILKMKISAMLLSRVRLKSITESTLNFY